MRIRVRTLLVTALSVSTLVFSVATVVVWFSFVELRSLEARRSELDRAKHLGHLTLAAVQEQYIHQAHTIIAGDDSHLGHYGSIREAVGARISELERVCGGLGLVGAVDRVAQRSRDMHQVFVDEIRARLAASDIRRLSDLHDRLKALTTAALQETIRLNSVLEDESRQAADLLEAVLQRTQLLVASLLLVAVIASVAMGIYILQRVGRPLARMHQAIERIQRGDLRVRLKPEGPVELVEVATSFNGMVRAVERMRTRVAQTERMTVMGELAAGVAHEINNPLAVITGYVKILKRSSDRPEAQADLDIISQELRRCQEIVHSLLELARPRSLELETFDAIPFAREIVDRARQAPGPTPARVTVVAGCDPCPIHADSRGLAQVLFNLLKNAFHAAGAEGEVEVGIERDDREVVIAVEDSGSGIAEEGFSNLFRPFQTTKEEGTGLGLAISLSIVRTHGGTIEVRRHTRLGGAGFYVHLPADPPTSVQPGLEYREGESP